MKVKNTLAGVTLIILLCGSSSQAQTPIVGPSMNLQHTLPASVRTQKMKSEARNTRDATRKQPAANSSTLNQNSKSGSPTTASKAPKIHRSAADGQADSVSEALEQDPQLIRKKDASGYTALHHAAIGGHSDVVEVLLQNGAKLDTRGRRGETALYLAASKGNHDVVKVLTEKGAALDVASSDGKTPLHKAAMAGHAESLEILLDAGADPSVQERGGKTPLDFAERYRAGEAERIIRSLKKAMSE